MKRHPGIFYFNLLKKSAALCVAAALVFIAGCGNAQNADILSFSGKITEKSAVVYDKSIHLINPGNFNDTVAQSGLLSLYIDDKSYGVALYQRNATEKVENYAALTDDNEKEKYWYTLPAESNVNYDYSAATFTIDVSAGGTLYHLNSQDNSVAFKNVTCDVMGDKSTFTGYDLKYVVTVDEKTAAKVDKMKIADNLFDESDFSKSDIIFFVNVKFDLRDGNLFVTANWKNLSGNESAVIERLGLLEFFGADDKAENGDFILVPDGCGAVIKTASADSTFMPLSFVMYGDDEYGENTYPAVFPAFGAKQGDSAFVTIIERGDACATVTADRATGKSGFNRVGVSFKLVETSVDNTRNQTVRYTNPTYSVDEVRLCVRLLSGGNASYGGMAAACREQFMRNKVISANTVVNEEYLPFNLNIIGASTGVSRLYKRLEAVKTLTSFEQAQDMLSRMKAKGINNINIRYIGALRGGENQNQTGRLSLMKRLGGKKGFDELSEYSSIQGHSLYLDVNLLTWNGEKLLTLKAADNIKGQKATVTVPSELKGALGTGSYVRHVMRLNKIEKAVIGLLTDANRLEFDGFCVNDAGSLLYSDYSNGFTDRQTASGILAASVSSLAARRKLMMETGNFYAVKQADVIVGLPLSPSAGEKKGSYESVPFVQMIIHGTLDYSGEPVNLSDDADTAMLRCIEYGACPSFEWCYENTKAYDNAFFYEDWLNDAAAFYTRANDTLGDLRDTRITNNYETETKGVYCTEYENGSVVYVNYNDESSEYNGITISAKSFIKID